MLVFPPFRLDADEERLWKGEAALTLRRKPFAILRYLAEHPQKLVTHDELLEHVWGGAVVSDSAMRSHLHELRQVLGEGVIETVIGRGYRFVARLQDDVGAPAAVTPAPASTSTSAPAHVERVDPLVVGREPELDLLRAALGRACEGRRQLVFVTGEPGIGKTTLVRTFVAGLEPRAVIFARGACFEQHGTPEPYLPIIEALSALSRSRRGPQVLAALVRHAPTFVARMPQLLGDDQVAEVQKRAAFGSESRQLRELCEALEATSAQDPLVLVLEDMQWSDVATIDLLSLLGQRQERARLLVIATSRHAEIQRPDHPLNHALRSLVARAGASLIQVPKISTAAVQTFVDRRFPGHAFPPQLTELVARITGGTPLYVVSLLEELAGRGMLAEQDGRWTLAASIDEVQAHRPASVQQLIDMQLDRLPVAEQRVLEAASLVGAEFTTQLVAAALEQPREQVDDVCDAFARRALFLRAEPDDRYGFTHALVQEVCAERSSPARRQRWHRLVAEALERDPRAAELSHLLAKHFEAAGDAARAIPAYLAAGRQAATFYATADSVALCTRALDLVPRLPASRARDLLELQILETTFRQVNSSSFDAAFAGRDPRALYSRAIDLARSLGDPPRLYAAITELCNYCMIVARYDQTDALTSELERLEQQHAFDPALLQAGIFARGYIAFFRADFATALRLFERLVPAEQDDSPFHANLPGRVVALGHLACVRWVVGEPDRALDEARATLELAQRLQVPILQALGHVVLGRLRFLRRDPLPIVEEGTLAAARAASLDLGLSTEANAFALWAEARRAPLALSAIEPMLESLEQRLHAVSTCSTLVGQVLIEVLRISGHAERARALTDRIIAFALERNETVYLPELLRLRGELREESDPTGATRDYREAVALAKATGAHELEKRAAEKLAPTRRRRKR